jgi:tetratricopeptide (TPR) repeat protein
MRERLPLAEFEQRWWRGDFWGIVVVRPDRLPRTATPEELASATLALERFDGEAAQAAFDALAQRTIALKAWLELGSKELEQGDPNRAVKSFTNATRIDPTVADAWRGLATAQLALGQAPDAAVAARRALALGGPKADDNAALLKQIEARLK